MKDKKKLKQHHLSRRNILTESTPRKGNEMMGTAKRFICMLLAVILVSGSIGALPVSANSAIINTLNGTWTVHGLGSATINANSNGNLSGVAVGYSFTGNINFATRAITLFGGGATFTGTLNVSNSTITGFVSGFGNVTLSRVGSVITPGQPSTTPRGVLDRDDIPFVPESGGDPVHMVTGSFYWDYTDFSLHGAQPLHFTRHYNSESTNDGELGYGMRHNFMYFLEVESSRIIVHEANGNRTIFDINGENFVQARHTDRTLQRNGDGFLMTDRAHNRHFFNSGGYIAAIEDFAGNRTEITRNGSEIESISNRSGTFYFTYTNGRITRITDHTGRFISYEYNASGHLITFTNADGNTLEYVYENNRITQITDFNGNIFLTNIYDNYGRVIRQYMLDQGTFTFAYDTNNRVTTLTNGVGAVSRHFYNVLGQITAVEDSAGRMEYVYEDGRLVEIIDGLGNRTAFTHDAAGNRTSVRFFTQGNATPIASEYFEYNSMNLVTRHTQRDGTITQFAYDSRGNMISVTDGAGNTHTFAYDSNNNMITATDPRGNTTTFTHDSRGNVTSQTDPMGNVTHFAHDETGRLIRQTSPDGGVLEFTFSPAGKLIQTTDARGGVHQFTLDGNGFNISVVDALGNTTSAERDAQNNPTRMTDVRGNITLHEYDLAGNLITITDPQGNTISHTYDVRGRITSTTDARGNTWTFTYDAENRLTSETNPLGNRTNFAYSRFGQLTGTTTPMGNTFTNVFDSMGRLVRTIDPEGNETTFEYDNAGRLTRTVNADGTFSRLTYNESGWLISATDETGATTSYTYNANGQVLTITDALGGVTTFTYDGMGRALTETNALGGVTSFTYDTNGNILTITNPMGGVTTFEYDALNRITATTDPLGGITRIENDANGNVIKITNAEGGVSTFVYDSLNRLISQTDAEGHTVSFEHDENGNIISQTDGRGNTILFQYDELNRLILITDEIGGTIENIFDNDGRVIRTIDQQGAETSFAHDRNGRVTRITDALGNATNIEYDAMGRVVRTTDALGAATRFAYTPTGNLQTITDAQGGVITFAYDALGRLTSETNPLGETTSFTHDALGRVTSITNALGHTEYFEYDANNRIVSVTDRNGEITRYTYDSNGNLVSVTDPEENIANFEYDRLNRLVRVIGNANEVTVYQYDGRGLVTRVINAVGDSRIYVYDQNGNLVSRTDEDGHVTNFVHDARNLLQSISYNDGRTANFAYNAAGQLVQLADWTGTTDFTLDLLGRITAINDQNNRTVGFTYDAAGNQTQVQYPDGTSVTRTFDSLGRMTAVQTPEGLFSYTRDRAGRVNSRTLPNGITESFTHDRIGQMLTITQTNTDGSSEILNQYTYDPMGNVLSRTNTPEPQMPSSITLNEFNSLNQLTTSTERDLHGNILSRFEFTHDRRGNLIQERDTINNTTQTFTFDATNRKVRGVNHQGEESLYNFNALNALIGRETYTAAGTFTTDFVIDYTSFAPTVLMEFGSDDIIRRHIYGNIGNGLSRISTTLTNPTEGNAFFIQHDRLGSGRFATDATGERVAHTLLDEWGNVLERVKPIFSENEINILNKFTNHIYDDVLGIYFAQARFYDPARRRFISPDPHWSHRNRIFGDDLANLIPNHDAIRQSANLYAFVLNNPLRFVDVSGLWKRDVHVDYTKRWAEQNFFSPEQAAIIAEANIAVDSASARVQSGSLSWHLNTNTDGTDSRVIHAERMLAQAVSTWNQANENYLNATARLNRNSQAYQRHLSNLAAERDRALQYLGTGLHPLQDIYAHGNLPGTIGGSIQHFWHGGFAQGFDNIRFDWTDETRTRVVDSGQSHGRRWFETRDATFDYFGKFICQIGGTEALMSPTPIPPPPTPALPNPNVPPPTFLPHTNPTPPTFLPFPNPIPAPAPRPVPPPVAV